MDSIDRKHLDDLALGAVFLATGGGGDPYLPKLIADHALQQYGAVRVIAPDELQDDMWVVPLGSVGAPTVSLELLPSMAEAITTLRAFENFTGKKADAVAAFEVGGGNSLVPLVAAAALGVPVVDGDGMGRAFPEAQMMSYAIAGIKPTPALATDYAGNIATFKTCSTKVYERHIRAFAAAAGGMVTVAEHAMYGRELQQAIIPGTLSFSIELGKVLRQHRGPAEALQPVLASVFKQSIYGECRHLFSGKVISKSVNIVDGYDIGEALVQDFKKPDKKLSVNIKNEFLLARIDGVVHASVPDLIVIVDFETSEPINCERLRFGQRVAVFAIGCPEFYRSAAALSVTEPRCFGFDVDYKPLEALPTMS